MQDGFILAPPSGCQIVFQAFRWSALRFDHRLLSCSLPGCAEACALAKASCRYEISDFNRASGIENNLSMCGNDGFTPEQRFFLGWAQVWAEKYTPEAARLQAQSDPHPLSRFRVNGPLSNMPKFAEAFQYKAGDAMVREGSKRCQIW